MFGIATNKLGKMEKNKLVKEGDCIFPFKYKHKLHNECFETEKGPICATTVNERKTLKTYGYCKKKIKTLKKKKKLKLIVNKIEEQPIMPVIPKPPYNEAFIELLGKLETLMIRKGENMRARAYMRAQQSLMLYDKPIMEVKQISHLKNIGNTILLKFQEFIDTGTLNALEKEKTNPLLLFTNIYGVGPKKAEELIKKGITTIAQLRENKDELNEKQKLGLQYYEDIEKRIPREEITQYESLFKKFFKQLNFPNASMQIVGSYRRGAKNSGDIDVIMTDKEHNPDLLNKFIDKLVQEKIILHKLADGKIKVLAIGKLPSGKGAARRLDFLYTPPNEYAFAVLYFTGSKIFNTVMRQRALNMGYSLNEHGIYKMISGKKGSRIDKDFPNEKSIFDFLEMEYKNPEERKDARAVVIKTKVAEPEPEPEPEPAPAPEPELVSQLSEEQQIKDFSQKGISYLKTLNENKLVSMIKYANDIYYNNPDDILLTDEQFDILKEYVENKYPKNTVLKEIGAPISVKKNKVLLPYPMPSMDKIKPSTKALDKWLGKYNKPLSYALSAKMDGVSGLYSTMDGKEKLYTRGDGTIGQDISYFIPYLNLPKEKNIVVRGEFIINKKNFEKYFKDKKNARNTVAGIVNKISANPEELKHVEFVAYEVLAPELSPADQFNFLQNKLKMNTVKFMITKEISNDSLSKILVDWRSTYDYDIDGVIVAHNSIYSERSAKNPEHAFAFKMILSDQKVEAKVVDVIWTPSKDGYLKPRVQIEPVSLGGVTITYATGKNAAFIEKHKVGIGAIIELIRSGDVIPDIQKVVVPAPQPSMPDVPYEWNKTHVDIMLLNKEDNDVVREKNIALFFKTLEVEGLGSGVVSKLVKAGFNSVSSILKMNESDFLKIEGFKQKLANKIYTNIQNAVKKANLVTFMKASNIFGRGYGERKITPVLEKYPDILVSENTDQEKINMIVKVDGWSTKTATGFVKNIPDFLQFMKDCGLMDKVTYKKEEKKIDSSHVIYGKKVVFTGFRDKGLMEEITEKGGIISSAVSKNTFAVIVKNLDEDTGSAEKARALGVSIFTPDSFRELYF